MKGLCFSISRDSIQTQGFQRSEIAGIPVFWAEAPPPHQIVLAFRSGKVDESLPTSGINHLVEHLALSSLRQEDYQYNGWVEPLRTGFWARGEEAQLSSFLSAVTGGLRSLPAGRLEAEIRILQTESEGRRPGFVDRIHELRFGARGWGLGNYPEHGFRRASSAELQEWADRWFGSANAVLWTTGPLDGLELELHAGQRRPPPPIEPIPGRTFPSWARSDGQLVAISWTSPRTDGSIALAAIASRRIGNRLRYEEGVSYQTRVSYQRLGADLGHHIIAADCHKDHGDAAVAGVVAVLEELASSGPTEEEVAEYVSGFRKAMSDPDAVYGRLDGAAGNELLSTGMESDEERFASLEGIPASSLALHLEGFLDSSLLLVPAGASAPAMFRPVANAPRPAVRGTGHRRVPLMDPSRRLVSGPDGVTLIQRKKKEITVRFAECEAMLRWDDGTLSLIDSAGTWIRLKPALWSRSKKLQATIEQGVPSGKWIPLGAPTWPKRRPGPPAVGNPVLVALILLTWIMAAIFIGGYSELSHSFKSPLIALAWAAGLSLLAVLLTFLLVRRIIGKRRAERAAADPS